ncbi:MAG: hypothetical protein EBY24_08865 [Betaproteobacteria bacterium]|nr:hypothetical protein [Betaproteobacteria bacterium]
MNGIGRRNHAPYKTDILGNPALGALLFRNAAQNGGCAIAAGFNYHHRQTNRNKFRECSGWHVSYRQLSF